MVQHVDRVDAPAPDLVGARCDASTRQCTCRTGDNTAEIDPPPEGKKRLEIRLSAHGGTANFVVSGLGQFSAAGAKESCYYVDVDGGNKAAWQFSASADYPDMGFAPRFSISEYGPKGPWWYEVLSFECAGVGGKCDDAGIDDWKARLAKRKRGRFDPCGSMVVTSLNWETSGALAHREYGWYPDLSMTFDVETKAFATAFAPHSTECIPK